MLTDPAPFHKVFCHWADQRKTVVEAGWTNPSCRHFCAIVDFDGQRCFAKLALARKKDLDEKDMLSGLRREVWWSQVIQELRKCDPEFPFTSPMVIETNVHQEQFEDEVAWVIFEFVKGCPIVSLSDLEDPLDDMDRDQKGDVFNYLFDLVTRSMLALEKVHPSLLEEMNLPPLPSPPHGMRRWQKRGLLDMKTAVLGNGAFDIKNFWQTWEGQLIIIDNEFAGWYPKHDSLSYLYHRLYCNEMRPDLARRLLTAYIERSVFPEFPRTYSLSIDDQEAHRRLSETFFDQFATLLKPRVMSGWYYDTARRFTPPWHEKQRLRYKLFADLWYRRYDELYELHK